MTHDCPPRLGYPFLGYGIGLRTNHFNEILENPPEIDWFEIISENFFETRGRLKYFLDKIRVRFPIVMHGVALSIGSTDPLDRNYLALLKQLANEIEPVWVSDHLCWTGIAGINTHDLLPLPLSEESLRHVIRRVGEVQDFLERRIVLENPSSYVTFHASTISEWEFLASVANEADCGILLDVNNVYVSATNHEFDPVQYLKSLPASRIVQIHLAGHTNCGTHLVDTHDGPVIDAVWNLYRLARQQFGEISTLLEWDARIPSLEEVCREANRARDWAALPDRPDDVSSRDPLSIPHPAVLVPAETE